VAEPDPRDVPPEDLDEKGLDRRGLADTLAALNGAVEEMAERSRLLGEVTVDGSSDDEQVSVQVTRAGRLVRLRLREGVTRRYDLEALGDLIARTVRDTQRRARAEYDRVFGQIEQPEFIVTPRGLRRAPRS